MVLTLLLGGWSFLRFLGQKPWILLLVGSLVMLGYQQLRYKRMVTQLTVAQEEALTAEASLNELTVYREGATIDPRAHLKEVAKAEESAGLKRTPIRSGSSVEVISGSLRVQTKEDSGVPKLDGELTYRITLSHEDYGATVIAGVEKESGVVLWDDWRFDERFSVFYERFRTGTVNALDLRLVRRSTQVPERVVWERSFTIDNVSIKPPRAPEAKKWVWYGQAGWTPSNGGTPFALIGVQRDLWGGFNAGASVYQGEEVSSIGAYLGYAKRF